MSFTYDTTDPMPALSKLRLIIGDTDSRQGKGALPNGENLQDEELNPIITLAGSWTAAVPVVLELLATRYSRMGKGGEGAPDYINMAVGLRAQADAWRKQGLGSADLVGFRDTVDSGAATPHPFGGSQYGFTVEDASN